MSEHLPWDKPRVLIVDDEPVLLHMMVRMLTREGYEVTAFGTGEETLAWLEAHRSELVVADATLPITVVSDVRLPLMNGCSLGREIVKRWPDTRMLFISGYIEDELREKRICPGNLPLLPKPFTPQQFLRAVEARMVAEPWAPNEEEWPAPEGGWD